MTVPNDPIILMSYLNTKLRDEFSSLEALCRFLELPVYEIEQKMQSVGYAYSVSQNQFLRT